MKNYQIEAHFRVDKHIVSINVEDRILTDDTLEKLFECRSEIIDLFSKEAILEEARHIGWDGDEDDEIIILDVTITDLVSKATTYHYVDLTYIDSKGYEDKFVMIRLNKRSKYYE